MVEVEGLVGSCFYGETQGFVFSSGRKLCCAKLLRCFFCGIEVVVKEFSIMGERGKRVLGLIASDSEAQRCSRDCP